MSFRARGTWQQRWGLDHRLNEQSNHSWHFPKSRLSLILQNQYIQVHLLRFAEYLQQNELVLWWWYGKLCFLVRRNCFFSIEFIYIVFLWHGPLMLSIHSKTTLLFYDKLSILVSRVREVGFNKASLISQFFFLFFFTHANYTFAKYKETLISTSI